MSSPSTGPRRSPAGSTSCHATRRADAPPPAPAPAAARRRTASGRRRSRAIRNLEESLADEPAARADPDGDRLGQDLHRGERRLPAHQVTAARGAILFLVDRANLGRQTLKEFQALRRPRTTAASSPSSTTSSTSTSNTIDPVARVVDHDDPAPLLDAARRGGARPGARRAVGATTLEPDRAGRRSTTTRRSRPRRSTSSSSTSATARSTASGARCSTTSTPSSIGLTATPEQADVRLLQPEPRHGVRPRARRSPTASTSTSTSTGSAPRSPSRAAPSRPGLVTEFRDRADARDALGEARRGRHLRRRGARPRRRRRGPDPHRHPHVPRAALHRDLPRPHRGAEDADLRQGRLARRRHRPDRARGVRQGQRLRREDHLQARPGGSPTTCSATFRNSLQPAHRRHRRHDRHRHRREAARVRLLHARGQEPRRTSSR